MQICSINLRVDIEFVINEEIKGPQLISASLNSNEEL